MIVETEVDVDAMDEETINVLSKRKLPLANLGNTPKKAWGSPEQFPQMEEKIFVLTDKLKDHVVSVWTTIDMSSEERHSPIAESSRGCKRRDIGRSSSGGSGPPTFPAYGYWSPSIGRTTFRRDSMETSQLVTRCGGQAVREVEASTNSP